MQDGSIEGQITPFYVKDCTLIAISTGRRAHDLRELRDRILEVPLSCIYHHFWAGLMRPVFDEPDFQNDFAAWAHHHLHDELLAERLNILSPTTTHDLEALRREVAELVEERLDEEQGPFTVRARRPFFFVRSQTVVFDTGRVVERPESLAHVVKDLSVGSIFYHFIDARRRTIDGYDDFSDWLVHAWPGHERLVAAIRAVDPYFASLTELRQQLATLLRHHAGEVS